MHSKTLELFQDLMSSSVPAPSKFNRIILFFDLTSPFNDMCFAVAIIFGILGIISVVQIFQLLIRDTGSLYSSKCLGRCIWPATVQHEVHLLLMLLCFTRLAFFTVAPRAWNAEEGVITSDRVAFYMLDQASVLIFFSLTSILSLFWAELYYIATDNFAFFTNIVKPTTIIINVLAYIGLICCWFLDKSADYEFIGFTYLAAITYIMASLAFAFYTHVAGAELKNIPIELSARKERLANLQILAAVCITSLIAKAVVLICVTGKTIPSTTPLELILIFMYYILLEVILPSLSHHRTSPHTTFNS